MGFLAREVKSQAAVRRAELREKPSPFGDRNRRGEASRNHLWQEGLEKGIPRELVDEFRKLPFPKPAEWDRTTCQEVQNAQVLGAVMKNSYSGL